MAQPAGLGTTRWQDFRRWLLADPLRGQPCWFCGHHFRERNLAEIEHRISPSLRPDLAWSPHWRGEPFLVPVHGGGKRRCPEPSCDLDCNAIAGGNAAPRDALGRSAQWSPEFLAGKQAERRTYRAREGRSSVARTAARNRGLMPGSWAADPPPRKPPRKEPSRRVWADAGRPWLLSLANEESGGNPGHGRELPGFVAKSLPTRTGFRPHATARAAPGGSRRAWSRTSRRTPPGTFRNALTCENASWAFHAGLEMKSRLTGGDLA